ncbi:hypothetical protein [Clostridium sp. OS1-26]|nr:hypothetical protein [Clostridium sp. OS1-26]WML33221.1 hypothetical protein RCG18_17955 [Clostridium sp. OS1-26]
MDELMNKFMKSCLELGKELLDKEELTQKEEEFLKNLDLVVEKYMK